jgi:VWFA-related protein
MLRERLPAHDLTVIHRLIARATAAAVLGAAVAALAAQGGQPPQPAEQRQIFRARANFVRVDATVLRNGKPVTDLAAADFQVFENGVLQKVETFEYVRTDRPLGVTPIEPSSSAAGFEAAADPRNRLFILFLDAYHVTQENSLQTPMPLVRLLDSLIAPTDLIGVMTPEMDIRDLIIGRKIDVIRSGLLERHRWGRQQENCRDRGNLDQIEKMYAVCYPPPPPPPRVPPCDLSITALNLIRRRRETFTLDVLRDLVRYIGANREARTAILLVSEGWPLYRPSDSLANIGAGQPPTIRIQPGGRLGTRDSGDFNVDQDLCARHLREVAQRDNFQAFRDLIDYANTNNASFYIVDPGGLRTGVPSIEGIPGALNPRGFTDTLRTLADNTNGNAIVETNDIARGLQNLIDDVSGYYLIGYYSGNDKPDGRYRTIDVKVTRPGVEVRARKGYRALTAEEAASIAKASAAANAPVDPAKVAHGEALGRLSRLKPNTVLYLHATVDPGASSLLVVGELSSTAARSADWRQGGEAQILVSTADGTPAGSGHATIAPGGRAFLARVPIERASVPVEYEVGVRMKAAGASASLLESIRAARTTDPIGEPIAFRSAGPQQPVATFLWYRTEQARFEAPLAAGSAAPAGRLLDQAGNPMPVPVAVSVREEGASRWAVATFPLAPLSPADYVLELSSGAARRYIALRVER